MRYEVPDAGLLVAREDAVERRRARADGRAIRPTPTSPSPANGFTLAGTMTTPPAVAGRLRHPAVLLVGGTSPADRDQVMGGVPVFAQLAKMLADSRARRAALRPPRHGPERRTHRYGHARRLRRRRQPRAIEVAVRIGTTWTSGGIVIVGHAGRRRRGADRRGGRTTTSTASSRSTRRDRERCGSDPLQQQKRARRTEADRRPTARRGSICRGRSRRPS